MIRKREKRLSHIMITVQVIITLVIFQLCDIFFHLKQFSLKENILISIEIACIWGFFMNKFNLGIIFRTNKLMSMLRGYLVTICFGSTLIYLEIVFSSVLIEYYHPFFYICIFSLIDLLVLFAFKWTFYNFMHYIRSKGYNTRNVVLIVDETSIPFIDSFIHANDWGYSISAILSLNKELITRYNNAYYVENIYDVRAQFSNFSVDDIFYCLPIDDTRLDLENIIKRAEEVGVSLHLIQPDFLEKLQENKKYRANFESNFVTYTTVPRSYYRLKVKEAVDMFLSIAVLILLSPVLLLICIIIKLDDGGPVFFKQERIGLNGRRFVCFKFRTMVTNAEELLVDLHELNESDGPTFKIENDPRITKIGRLLRKTSLDELPQFYNVIKGEMSVVGPRPPLLREVVQYERTQLRRLSMKPGITCIWQVSGRNLVSFSEWMQMDLEYIDNWSLMLDFKIILSTIGVIFKANGR